MSQQQLSIDAGLVKGSGSEANIRSFVPWIFLLGCAIITFAVLIADASFTPEQRMETFLRSGMYP